MDALRTLTSALGHYDPDAADNSPQASYRKAVRLTGQLASLVATWGRMQQGGGPIAPDPAMGHAANFLYMLTGERPSPTAIRAMDIALTLHADHELNASTFAARVAAATLTDMHSAVVAGIGTLKGPLHGGANAEVMKMLLEIGPGRAAPSESTRTCAASWRARRRSPASATASTTPRIRAPRTCAGCRRSWARRPATPAGSRCPSASRRIVRGEKKLYPNVDFYSASTYYTMGIAIDLYTPIFAVSRISGWTAHVLEQYANNRLIRPRADYTGPAYPQTWLPLEQR